MSKTVTVTGKITLPQEDGQAVAPYDLDVHFVYTKKIEFDQVYDQAVIDDPISVGSMVVGGAKLLLVKASIGGCTFKINGHSLAIPIAVGSYNLYVNPSSGFITSLSVTTTAAASIQILALA